MGRYSVTKKELKESSEAFEAVIKKERELSYMTRKGKY